MDKSRQHLWSRCKNGLGGTKSGKITRTFRKRQQINTHFAGFVQNPAYKAKVLSEEKRLIAEDQSRF